MVDYITFGSENMVNSNSSCPIWLFFIMFDPILLVRIIYLIVTSAYFSYK